MDRCSAEVPIARQSTRTQCHVAEHSAAEAVFEFVDPIAARKINYALPLMLHRTYAV